jgi:hypothetical protein
VVRHVLPAATFCHRVYLCVYMIISPTAFNYWLNKAQIVCSLWCRRGSLIHNLDETHFLNGLQATTHYHSNVFIIVKVKESRYRPGVALRVPGGLGSQISWHSAREGGEVVSLTHRPPLPPGMFLVFIFTRGWVEPRALVRSKGNMSLKNPVTPPGFFFKCHIYCDVSSTYCTQKL